MDEIDSLISTIRKTGEDVWIAGPQAGRLLIEMASPAVESMATLRDRFRERIAEAGTVRSIADTGVARSSSIYYRKRAFGNVLRRFRESR